MTYRTLSSSLAAVLMLFCAEAAAAEPNIPKQRQITMAHVDSWGYQLQNVRPRLIAPDGFDILVVDYSRDGSDSEALKPGAVDRLRERSGQPGRIVLSYLSIGEAEEISQLLERGLD